jgi:hypothetical protein
MRYQDLGDLQEDARIDQIGQRAMMGGVIAFVTDADPGKADRYIAKLAAKFPQVKVIERFNGPVAGTVSVKVGIPKG